MTKLTLLSVMSALGSLFLFILFTIRATQEIGDQRLIQNDVYSVWKVVYAANVIFMLSAMINCLALYLILAFAERHYDKICKCCHGYLLNCCKYGINGCLGRQRKRWVKYSIQMSAPQIPHLNSASSEKSGTNDKAQVPSENAADDNQQNGAQTKTKTQTQTQIQIHRESEE